MGKAKAGLRWPSLGSGRRRLLHDAGVEVFMEDDDTYKVIPIMAACGVVYLGLLCLWQALGGVMQ